MWAVYQAVVLAPPLYGAETWTIKSHHLIRLKVFNNLCIRTILEVPVYQRGRNASHLGNYQETLALRRQLLTSL